MYDNPQAGEQTNLKFGVQVENHLGFNYDQILKVAKEAEKLGYDGLFICDHWQGRDEKLARQPCLEPWVTLAALASTTKKLRLGTLVSAVGYRYPSVLAKMAATLDNISNGRLQLGIGAGWYQPEYTAYGIPFPPTKQRMRQLSEAVQIIRSMWTQEKTTFHGTEYNVEEAYNYPKPIQHHPKIWVGGTGEKLLLKVVAKHADGWNAIATGPDDYARKLKLLEDYAASNGRIVSHFEQSVYASALAAKTEKEFMDTFGRYYSQFKKVDESLDAFAHRLRKDRPFLGTFDEINERVEQFSKLGVRYVIFYFPDKDELGLMRQFAEHVLPTFNDA